MLYFWMKFREVIQITCYLFIILLQISCSSIGQNRPDQKLGGYREFGKASYYAMKYQSSTTASGERFNQNALTAAHKKLPFGTRVLVTNVKNGKSVEVRINDRGPFVEGRIIDLSRSAFSNIGDLNLGVIDVEIKIIR